jgi:hypothetical protein
VQRINIYIQGPSNGRFAQAYLDRLGELLAAHLTTVTGLALNGKRWFMFNVWDEVQSPQPSVFTLRGDIIGPDSVAYEAEITWQEADGSPKAAGWSKLCVRALQRDYGEIQPPIVPIGAMPFEIEWRAWWDSHIPDFFMDIALVTASRAGVVDNLRTFIRTLDPAYESLKSDGTIIHVHIDFGASAQFREHIIKLMEFIRGLHAEHPLTKVSIGIEQDASA